ncbi:hypothetical protein D3C86_1903130 [compost metagenome]
MSVATISPGPSMLNLTGLFAIGAVLPSLSATRKVMKDRSRPSAAICLRSGARSSLAALPTVRTVDVVHSLPCL